MDRSSLVERPRRNRRTAALRDLVRETTLTPADLVQPLFVIDGTSDEPIESMPGCARLTPEGLLREAHAAWNAGVRAVALFPAIDDTLKDPRATESLNPEGLLPRVVRQLKRELPDLLVITDVAMDPYSSDGHDGIVENGEILNDPTLAVLADMAVVQAEAGADLVAPSDMMDGRVQAIRTRLDDAGHDQVGILAYTAKYASSYYGPFRDALDSAPKHGDKKTYQMDAGNVVEAIREARLDVAEGADIVMVKPAGPYLDVIAAVRAAVDLPVAAYQVSGEYAMVRAVAERGWMDGDALMLESLTGIKRAGASIILTYFATRAAELLG